MTPTAVITGASAGIGRATAFLLANKGYQLVLAARHNDPLEAVARQIKEQGGQALTVPTDVTDEKQVNNNQRWWWGRGRSPQISIVLPLA